MQCDNQQSQMSEVGVWNKLGAAAYMTIDDICSGLGDDIVQQSLHIL